MEFHSVSRTSDDTKADLAGNGKKFWHKYNVSSFGESTKSTVNNGVTPGPDFTPVPVTNTEVVYKLHTEDSAVLGATSRTYRLFDLTRTTTTYMGWTSTVETKLDSTSTLALDGGSEIADSPFRETFEILAGAERATAAAQVVRIQRWPVRTLIESIPLSGRARGRTPIARKWPPRSKNRISTPSGRLISRWGQEW